MRAERDIPEPGELVYAASPSWAPLIFAFAAALALCGVFIEFMLPGWLYSAAGIVVMLAALRNMGRGAVGDYFRLPRKQRARGAVLPVEQIRPQTD